MPNSAKIVNLYESYNAKITLEKSNNNVFKILVNVDNIPDGNYRLKFTVNIFLFINHFL